TARRDKQRPRRVWQGVEDPGDGRELHVARAALVGGGDVEGDLQRRREDAGGVIEGELHRGLVVGGGGSHAPTGGARGRRAGAALEVHHARRPRRRLPLRAAQEQEFVEVVAEGRARVARLRLAEHRDRGPLKHERRRGERRYVVGPGGQVEL